MNNFKKFLLFFYLVFTAPIFAEGFVAGTRVKTEEGCIPIEQIKEGDTVCVCGFDGHYYSEPVISIDKNETPFLIKLIIDDEVILTAPEQCFLKEQIWTPAVNLQSGDKILACSGYLTIEAIELFPEPVVVFAISVANRGNFYVSNHEVLAHNMVPMIANVALRLAQTPLGQWVLEKATEYGTQVAVVAAAGYLASRYQNARQPKVPEKKSSIKKPTSSGGGSGRPPDDPNDPWRNYNGYRAPKNLGDWDSKEPKITRTYDNAPYHHKVGNGIKSATPIDGQAALDKSYVISETGTSPRRIAVSDGQIVVLNRTQVMLEDGGKTEVFHGHVRDWADLTKEMRRALKKNGVVTKGGKIIK